MNSVIRSVSVLFLAGMLAVSGIAQVTTAADPAASPSDVLFGGLIDKTVLPANFAAFGAGIQPGAGTLNGVSALCHSVAATSYVCAKSLFSGSTSANTISYKQVVMAQRGFVFAIDTDAGVATGANGGIGGAFAGGGSLLYNVSRLPLLRSHPGVWLGASLQWDKRDVSEFAAAAGTVGGIKAGLKPFASRGDYTFFFGKSW